jgi:hypothetical protein
MFPDNKGLSGRAEKYHEEIVALRTSSQSSESRPRSEASSMHQDVAGPRGCRVDERDDRRCNQGCRAEHGECEGNHAASGSGAAPHGGTSQRYSPKTSLPDPPKELPRTAPNGTAEDALMESEDDLLFGPPQPKPKPKALQIATKPAGEPEWLSRGRSHITNRPC